MIHANSIETYRAERDALRGRAKEVFQALEMYGPQTDRELMGRFGTQDPNYVRPRITELKKLGLVIEVENVPDEITGKTVRVVKAVTEGDLRKLDDAQLALF